MTQPSHHVEPIRPGGGMRRLRQGDLGRLKEAAHTVISTSQFVSTVRAEIERSVGDQRTVVVMRIHHRALPGTADRALKGQSLPTELTDRFRQVDESIRVTVVSPTELMAFVPGLGRRSDAQDRARAVLDALLEPISVDGIPHHLAPVLGAALHDAENPTVEALVEGARLAVEEGGASTPLVMFSPYQRVRHHRGEDVRRALRAAILGSEITGALQPAYDLTTGRIRAFEAYARWFRQGKGMVPPVEFVATAEELGMSHVLGRQILARALGPVTGWVDSGLVDDVTVWLNVSLAEVMHPEFLSALTMAAEIHSAVTVGLELAPSPTAGDRDVHEQLKTLVSRGVRIAIADFGIGNANLTVIQQLPYDSVKLHRSLNQQITRNHEAAELVRLLIETASVLGLEVTAQGIESSAQLELVRSFGADLVQGFALAEPFDDLDALEAHLLAGTGRA